MKKWLKLVGLIYLFILSIEIIKKASFLLAPDLQNFFLQNLTPIKAIASGWFTTSLVQSSGAVSTIAAAFTANGLISLQTAVYILIGASLGTTITALVISIVTATKQKKDFRHSFEIGLAYAIYSALLVIIVLVLEFLFNVFSNGSIFLAEGVAKHLSLSRFPDLISIITAPLTKLLFKAPAIIGLVIGFAILIFALKFMGKSVIKVLGGEEKAKNFMNRYFDKKYKAYFLGVILTAILFSSSITIGLLVPLAASRLISLRRAIPFILGADVGTFTDTFIAALIIGETSAMATAIAYLLFGLIGTIIFLPNVNRLTKATKYISKRLIKISRKKALYILIGFILIPLVIIFIF